VQVAITIFDSVRNNDIFVIQSTSPPVNDTLMELILMVRVYACLPPRPSKGARHNEPMIGFCAHVSVLCLYACAFMSRSLP
jgi:hypothetical protein